MEIQTIIISEEERLLVSEFMGEKYPCEVDFNRLMPVVEKICLVSGYEVEMNMRSCYIHTIGGNFSTTIQGDNRIESTYKAVVEFIKWYNKQQSNDKERI